jgi:choline dehydrogenase-like flavoprotein
MEAASHELSREWDVAVIGTGVGGATAGWTLASRGLSVLFLEKGTRIAPSAAEEDLTAPAARLARGWWPYPVSQQDSNGGCDRFFAPVGCALGGSSIHYAAALERMAASDFEALHAAHGTVPPWPVGFEEFEPFYAAAESLYRIAPVPAGADAELLSEWDLALMNTMRHNGLRPERLKVAMRYDAQCEECIGRVCPRDCKADARTICLEPALREERCRILEQCDVQSLESDQSRVRSVRARYRDQEIEIRARVFVLAAGALHSPQILLRSQGREWPNGLANRSDQVGRNLMFHTADIYAVWAPRRFNRQGRQRKALSVRDFYVRDGRRLGYVQSMGIEAGRGAVAAYLKDLLRRRGLRNELLVKLLAKLPSYVGAALLGNAGLFAAMTEDDPDPANRVVLDPMEPDGARFTYTITDDLRQRADALCKLFTRHIRPWRVARLSPILSMNYGHPCGTCRFGDDPASSVLDRNCKAHDLENLYVLDASFMPRSGSINPSLTIAANSMRVAPRIAAQLGQPAAG